MLKNPEQTKDKIVQWIRDYFAANGPTCSAVIGISGGKDSSVAAALCAEALGKDRVVGVLMPRGIQPDISDSQLLVDSLQIPYVEINIGAAADALVQTIEGNEKLQQICGSKEMAREAKINLPPRIRMATLYAVAQNLPTAGAWSIHAMPLRTMSVTRLNMVMPRAISAPSPNCWCMKCCRSAHCSVCRSSWSERPLRTASAA